MMESGLCQKDQTEMILNVKQKVDNDRKINPKRYLKLIFFFIVQSCWRKNTEVELATN